MAIGERVPGSCVASWYALFLWRGAPANAKGTRCPWFSSRDSFLARYRPCFPVSGVAGREISLLCIFSSLRPALLNFSKPREGLISLGRLLRRFSVTWQSRSLRDLIIENEFWECEGKTEQWVLKRSWCSLSVIIGDNGGLITCDNVEIYLLPDFRICTLRVWRKYYVNDGMEIFFEILEFFFITNETERWTRNDIEVKGEDYIYKLWNTLNIEMRKIMDNILLW